MNPITVFYVYTVNELETCDSQSKVYMAIPTATTLILSGVHKTAYPSSPIAIVNVPSGSTQTKKT